MTAIAATPPTLAFADLLPATPGTGGGEAFAPVLASLLTSPSGGASGSVMGRADPVEPGTPLPPSGIELPPTPDETIEQLPIYCGISPFRKGSVDPAPPSGDVIAAATPGSKEPADPRNGQDETDTASAPATIPDATTLALPPLAATTPPPKAESHSNAPAANAHAGAATTDSATITPPAGRTPPRHDPAPRPPRFEPAGPTGRPSVYFAGRDERATPAKADNDDGTPPAPVPYPDAAALPPVVQAVGGVIDPPPAAALPEGEPTARVVAKVARTAPSAVSADSTATGIATPPHDPRQPARAVEAPVVNPIPAADLLPGDRRRPAPATAVSPASARYATAPADAAPPTMTVAPTATSFDATPRVGEAPIARAPETPAPTGAVAASPGTERAPAATSSAPDDAPLATSRATTARQAATATGPATGPTPAAILPALQAFGAALHRAIVAERRPLRTPDAATVAAIAPTAIAPLVTTAPVDTTQPHWPEAMVARIDAIRDTQNEGDTRIRLHPDALGAVDVTLRQDAAGTHVHLHAAEPATQALLADAQPRLQQFAETRGLRLAGTEVATGATQTSQGWTDGNRRQPTPAPAPQTARRSATAPAASDDPTDTRLA